MAFYLSPLVDIKEVDLSTTIPAVATSIGVIVLRNPYKGPEMKQTFISLAEELVDTFGEPTNDPKNYVDTLSAVGALSGMNKLYVTAVRPEDATFGGLMSSTTTSGASGSEVEVAEFTALDDSGENSIKLNDFVSEDPDAFHDEVNPSGPIDIIASSRGAWGNNIRIAFVNLDVFNRVIVNEKDIDLFDFSQELAAVDTAIDDSKEFIVLVQALPKGKDDLDSNWENVEYWNVSTEVSATDGQGKSKFVETLINEQSSYIRVSLDEFQKDKDFTVKHTDWLKFDGGSDGDTTTNLDSEIMDALDLYRNAEEIDVNLIIDSDKSENVKRYIAEICEERKDCMGILDCKYEHVVYNKGSEVQSLTDWRKGLGSYTTTNLNISTDKVALYGNWLEVYDRWNKKYRWIPASGHLAAIYAQNDEVSDPWFAPAGLNRGRLTTPRRLAFNPTHGQRDILYKNGINPLVSFAREGKVVWGQKTMLSKPSAFDRVNVRRLFLVMEKAISTAVKYFLFEPNDAGTRLQIINMIEPFLRDVQGRRGIYEYMVICDERNNTPERIDRNELWVDILVKPVRTAEFIVLRFTATKTGASFTEIADSI